MESTNKKIRLTTEKPVRDMKMFELIHNGCFAKDGEVHFRTYESEAPARAYIRQLVKFHLGEELPEDEAEFDQFMMDFLAEPDSDMLTVYVYLYWAMVACSDLRSCLMNYEDKDPDTIDYQLAIERMT